MIHSFFIRRLAIAAVLFLGSFASCGAVTLLPQEQAIANSMINDPDQGRSTLILDPIIEGVARARAKDMAVRNYFSHVNPDGVAANYLLCQAGYKLPAWWGNDPTANNVESIAAGYSSPADTWSQWMNSPPHKVHLLGQNSFFASETHFGVGYYYDPNSTYLYYWVVITAPPEPIEIMKPGRSAQVATPSIAVAGTTDPGTNPALVQFRVENAIGAGAYQAATGVAHWSGTAAGLISGTNVIRAQSLDGSGKVIDETIRAITVVPTNPAPQAGRYTLVLPPNPATSGSSVPQGYGFAAIVVNASGAATVAGRLGDGTPYSASGQVAGDGTLAFHCIPSGAPAGSCVSGTLTFSPTDVSDLDGIVTWTKGSRSGDPFYPAGFTTQLSAAGSLYVPPATPPDASPAAATAAIGDGNLPQPINIPVIINQANKAAMVTPGSPDLTFSINPVSGVITGSIVMPDGNITRFVRGVVIQKQKSAFGCFRGVNQCGYFLLTSGT